MTTLREAAQQALEALEMSRRFVYADNRPQCDEAMDALRAALAQQDEPVKPAPLKRNITGRCTRKVCECEKEGLGPECIYLEPVDVGPLEYRGNSVAFIHQKMTAYRTGIDAAWDAFKAKGLHPDGKTSLADMIAKYTAPPQRLPLTEEEILKAIGWERAEMYMKLTPNFPVAEAKKETLKNARAIERAHGTGETK